MRISDWSSDVCSSDLADPARLVELFQLADLYGLEIHPLAMRAAARDAKLVDDIRREPRANAFFLEVLTSPLDPETVLRWMNEARSGERRVGKECASTCGSRGSPYHHIIKSLQCQERQH